MTTRTRSDDAALLRLAPAHDLEAERAVLGAVFLDARALDAATTLIAAEDFYRPNHGSIFAAMLALRRRAEPVDLVTSASELRALGQLEAIGGPGELASLAGVVPSAANVGYHARLVRDCARLRGAARALGEAHAALENHAAPVAERLATVDGIVRSATAETGESGPRLLDQALVETLADLRSDRPRTIPTGFRRLDDVTGGLVRGEVSILAARTAVGKSFTAGAIARHATLPIARGGPGLSCAFFTLEMTRIAVTKRLICAEGEIPQDALRDGNRVAGDLETRLIETGSLLAEHLLAIDDSPVLGPDRLRAKARGYQAEQGLDLVVLDYLQLMHGHAKRYGNRQEEVADVSRALKALAVELNVAVLALAQLNRQAEDRPRPRLSDLRESGALEQDAGLVLMLALDDEATAQGRAAGRTRTKVIQVDVAKNRHGPTGGTTLWFRDDVGRMDEADESFAPASAGDERPRAGSDE